MNRKKEIKLLKSAILTDADIDVLKTSPELFLYLINDKHKNLSKSKIDDDSKKIFIIYEEKLCCINVKLDEDKLSYEKTSDLYEITPKILGYSDKKLEVSFISEAIELDGDNINRVIFKAEQSHDGILLFNISNKFIMNANDLPCEYDLPRKKYTYYKDIEDNKKRTI